MVCPPDSGANEKIVSLIYIFFPHIYEAIYLSLDKSVVCFHLLFPICTWRRLRVLEYDNSPEHGYLNILTVFSSPS